MEKLGQYHYDVLYGQTVCPHCAIQLGEYLAREPMQTIALLVFIASALAAFYFTVRPVR